MDYDKVDDQGELDWPELARELGLLLTLGLLASWLVVLAERVPV